MMTNTPLPIGPATALRNRMNYLVQRQGMVASNIANAATPGYVAKDIKFQSALNQQRTMQMAQTSSLHLAGTPKPSTGQVVATPSELKNNGNAVNVTEELQKMAEVQIEYRMMSQLIGKYASMQRIALGRNQ